MAESLSPPRAAPRWSCPSAAAGALLPALLLGGCIPYAVGSTAHPVPSGELAHTSAAYFIPGGGEDYRDGAEGGGPSLYGVDAEFRFGLDEDSDVGIRLPGYMGAVLNYKRRFVGSVPSEPAVAVLIGAGVLHVGDHGHVELSILASAGERRSLTPYGGLRAMQAFPLRQGAPRDRPTLGAFAGVRVGTLELGISPEIGIFHDPSALGLRERNWIVVPSFTLHGVGFIRPFIAQR